MAYTDTNFKTKKALKDAVKKGDRVTFYQPGGMFAIPGDFSGFVSIEGPHYPKPHSWYAACVAENGSIVRVK